MQNNVKARRIALICRRTALFKSIEARELAKVDAHRKVVPLMHSRQDDCFVTATAGVNAAAKSAETKRRELVRDGPGQHHLPAQLEGIDEFHKSQMLQRVHLAL